MLVTVVHKCFSTRNIFSVPALSYWIAIIIEFQFGIYFKKAGVLRKYRSFNESFDYILHSDLDIVQLRNSIFGDTSPIWSLVPYLCIGAGERGVDATLLVFIRAAVVGHVTGVCADRDAGSRCGAVELVLRARSVAYTALVIVQFFI